MIGFDGPSEISVTSNNTLVATFNMSAEDYSLRRLTPGLLAQKYEALAKYKAKDDETKKLLAEALFSAVEKALRAVASPAGRIQVSGYIDEVKPLLDALAKPESAAFIPARAPDTLADIAVALVDRVGKVTDKEGKTAGLEIYQLSTYRDNTTALGSLVMEYAQTFSNMLDEKPKGPKLSTPNKLSA